MSNDTNDDIDDDRNEDLDQFENKEPVTIRQFVEKMETINKQYFDLVQMLGVKNNTKELMKIMIATNLADAPSLRVKNILSQHGTRDLYNNIKPRHEH